MNELTTPRSAQGSRVALELEALRQKHLAKNQRNKLKDLCSPLTTPEEAKAFLAVMRDKSHQRDITHKPPSNISADGMDSWYMQQRKREQELRKRRKEAEELLRGYRGFGGYSTPTSQAGSENLVDPSGMSYNTYSNDISQVTTCFENLDSEVANKGFEREYESVSDQQNSGVLEEKKEMDDSLDFREKLDSTRPTKQVSIRPVPPPLAIPTMNNDAASETVWRDFISVMPGAKFPAEKGRYHLYLSYACPGSHRVLIVRALKGLEDVISVTYVHPAWRLTNPSDKNDKHRGWVFGDPFGDEFTNTIGRGGPFPPAYNNTEPDPEFNAYSVRQIYEYAGDTSENPDLDLYTEDDDAGREKLTEVSEWLSPLMIHGVYRCGFAKQQREYDLAIAELCEAYDRCDDILQEQRYLTGDTLTDVDIRLFVSLIRFDEIYTTYFKANARLVMLTPSLLNFCRDIYQMPGIAETCDMDQIKAHFYGSHAEWNKYSVIPRGLGFMELLGMAHDRDEMSSFYEQQFVNDDDDTKTGNVGNQSSLPEEDTYTSEDDNEECPHNPSTTRVSEAGYLHMHTTNAESGDAFNPVGSNDEYQVYSSESELYQGSETLSGPMSQEDPA